jgi:hypothetical protein
MKKIILLLLTILLVNTDIGMTTGYVEIPKKVIKKSELKKDFYHAIGFKESGNDYTKVNSYGMLGKYQFSPKTLRGLGYKITSQEYLDSPELQEQAMRKLLKHNEKILRKQINKYSNDTIKGIVITKSGILASAHLVGPRAVKRWLRSNGKVTRIDGYGTSIENYMNKFKNYNIEI